MAYSTYDEVAALAAQLSPTDKARLLVQVAAQVAAVLESGVAVPGPALVQDDSPCLWPGDSEDDWSDLARIGAALSALGPAPVSSGEALAAMRR